LQYQHGRVGHAHAPLHDAARRSDGAEEDGDRDDRQRIVTGEEAHENAGKAVAGDQRGIGLAVDGGDLKEAGKAGAGAGDHAADDHQGADR